jgi:pyruvate dehydrogenase E2 component (dihydrolipoamide acetyltransferase)
MKDIIMPRYDPEMKTGRVAEWLKKEGDRVTKGEPLLMIDTEKVSVEVEAPESGILSKILVQPPTEVPIGTPLGYIKSIGEAAEIRESRTSFTSSAQSAASLLDKKVEGDRQELHKIGEEQFEERHRIFASPAARKAARDFGVDLNLVRGTGPKGRITSEDVQNFAASSRSKTQRATQIAGTAGKEQMGQLEAVNRPTTPAYSSISTVSQEPSKREEKFVKKALDTMRLTIAERMTKSWKEIPQVPLILEVSLAEVEKFKAGMEKLIGKRVSLTAIVAKALASSLRSFPDLNSRLENNNELLEYEDVDVSIAVALDHGLITPVVRSANRKTATDISEEIEDLTSRARSGKLFPSEVKGGTTTVSNLAGYGVDIFIPIINPPQVTIIGVGKTRTNSAGLPTCALTLVFDHRATDGARASQLLQKIKDFIESPYLLQMA